MAKTIKLSKDDILAKTIEIALLGLPEGNEKRAALSWLKGQLSNETITSKQMYLIVGRASREAGVTVSAQGEAFKALCEAAQGMSPQAVQKALATGFARSRNKNFSINAFECIGILDEAKQRLDEIKPTSAKAYVIDYIKSRDGVSIPVWSDGLQGNR